MNRQIQIVDRQLTQTLGKRESKVTTLCSSLQFYLILLFPFNCKRLGDKAQTTKD